MTSFWITRLEILARQITLPLKQVWRVWQGPALRSLQGLSFTLNFWYSFLSLWILISKGFVMHKQVKSSDNNKQHCRAVMTPFSSSKIAEDYYYDAGKTICITLLAINNLSCKSFCDSLLPIFELENDVMRTLKSHLFLSLNNKLLLWRVFMHVHVDLVWDVMQCYQASFRLQWQMLFLKRF